MKYILATTYDVFGYLIPGIVAAIGLCLIVGIQGPFEEADWSAVSATGWSVVLFGCYVVGLLLQSGSDCVRSRGEETVLTDTKYIDPIVLAKAHEKVSKMLSSWPGGSAGRGHLWRICETIVQLKGKTDTLDIYIYREGLYRGLVGATALLCAGVLRQALSGNELGIKLGLIAIRPSREALWMICFAALLACIGAKYRYRAFCAYRVRYSLYFVALRDNFADELGEASDQKPAVGDSDQVPGHGAGEGI